MIKLQNVIIMRITDFRRFFDLREFWNQRDEFFKQFEFINCWGKTERDYSLFVDNEKEKLLLAQFCNWICEPGKELCSVKLDRRELKIDDLKGGVQSCPLGLLQPYIENAKKQNKLTNKQIIGLTLLYLLLGADRNCSNIKVEYQIYSANGSSIDSLEEFNSCWEDRELPTTNIIEYPLKRCVFANMNSSKDIHIRCGSEKVILKPRDCVVGLFCSSKCYKLLPNEVSDTDKRTTLKLTLNSNSSSMPGLEIHKPDGIKYIDNVVAVAIENGGYPVYVTSDGVVHYDSSCFALGQRIRAFLKKECHKDLLAFTRDCNGNYAFYTSNEINY